MPGVTHASLVAFLLSGAGDVQAGYVSDDLKVAQIMLVLAAGMFIPGLAGSGLRPAGAALVAGAGAGLLLAVWLGAPRVLPALLILISALLGIGVAMRFRTSGTLSSLIILLIGIAFGLACIPFNARFPAALGLTATNLIAGAGAMICLTFLVSGLVAEAAPAWRAIALRIAGSWIVAIAVLLIAVSWQATIL
ncbi:hypothetical protein [Hyphomonas oceanitis]|uniref:Uncharacterized protein n=1 Tax=Hyphomonas oceanitis SCH89 TaxID=1280953 RepID=A0A059G5B3_9PROT|nr:hypothetical protein [Hyphomonas oceanitis]KDA01879.1 hypothetical protein HOC_13219 [Hyphomonas oceanitis SCH89]